MSWKSVPSINPCQSPDYLGAGVIQTTYDIMKAHGGKLDISTKKEKVVCLLFSCPIHDMGRAYGTQLLGLYFSVGLKSNLNLKYAIENIPSLRL